MPVILASRHGAVGLGTPSRTTWITSKAQVSPPVCHFLCFPSLISTLMLRALAVWISPVSRNYEGERTPYGDAYHGYWISDASQLNGKFGTSDDLMALSNEVHKRGMLLMVDVVVNDVMSLSNTSLDYSTYLFQDPVRFETFFLPRTLLCGLIRSNADLISFIFSASIVPVPSLLPCRLLEYHERADLLAWGHGSLPSRCEDRGSDGRCHVQ